MLHGHRGLLLRRGPRRSLIDLLSGVLDQQALQVVQLCQELVVVLPIGLHTRAGRHSSPGAGRFVLEGASDVTQNLLLLGTLALRHVRGHAAELLDVCALLLLGQFAVQEVPTASQLRRVRLEGLSLRSELIQTLLVLVHPLFDFLVQHGAFSSLLRC